MNYAEKFDCYHAEHPEEMEKIYKAIKGIFLQKSMFLHDIPYSFHKTGLVHFDLSNIFLINGNVQFFFMIALLLKNKDFDLQAELRKQL